MTHRLRTAEIVSVWANHSPIKRIGAQIHRVQESVCVDGRGVDIVWNGREIFTVRTEC